MYIKRSIFLRSQQVAWHAPTPRRYTYIVIFIIISFNIIIIEMITAYIVIIVVLRLTLTQRIYLISK